ncbi:MAG: DUF2480 family protein [Flammeovirgaceae bacterium]|nr:DUF2480 family protein [Flammeovirgaceae bacterium]
MDEIVNKVAQSGLVTVDLEKYYSPGERVVFDIKGVLFQGLILKEKDFRKFIESNDWSKYSGKFVAIDCTADAIIPTWTYMLLTIALKPHANFISVGSLEKLEERLFLEALSKIDWEEFRNAKVVVKGCGEIDIPKSVYVEFTSKLKDVASSIMFGEPCSTVPVFKKR